MTPSQGVGVESQEVGPTRSQESGLLAGGSARSVRARVAGARSKMGLKTRKFSRALRARAHPLTQRRSQPVRAHVR